MEYSKIIAISGLPGLYELINSKNDGAIVRSLDDGGTRFVSSRIHSFSHLESIEVYTVRDNVNLVEVLKAMESSDEKLPDEKDNSALVKYFQKVYKDLDFDRVYSSDLKKMVKWLTILKKSKVELKLTEPEQEDAPDVPAEVKTEEEVQEKPAKAAPKKEAKKKAAVHKEEEEPEKKPAKKAAAKKAPPKKKSGK